MISKSFGIFLSVLSILVPQVLTGCEGGTGLTPEEHIAMARDYYDQQEFSAATIELKNTLLKAPDNLEARRLLGLVYLDTGDAASAEKELRRAVELGVAIQAVSVSLAEAALIQGNFEELVADPPDESGISKEVAAALWAIHGDGYMGLLQLDEADRAYDKALSLQGDSPRAVTGKARLAASRGDIEQARRLLEQVHEANPDFGQAWSLMGDIERVQGNAQAAEAAYSKAIEPQKKGDIDLLNRALVRIYLGDQQGARSDIVGMNKQVPGHPMVAYARGLLAFNSKNYAEAQGQFENAVRALPGTSPAVYYLALTHYMQDHLQQAEEYGRRFQADHPASNQAAKLLAATRLKLGDLEGAESALQPVLMRNPADTYALKLMGEVELSKGRPRESVEYFQKVINLAPDSVSAYMKMGVSYMVQGEDRQGMEAFGKAARLNPEYQEADVYLILGHLKAKEYDEALAAAKRLRDKQPDSPTPYTLMAGVFFAQGDEVAGRDALATALEKDPGNRNAAHNLARLELRSGAPEKARALYEQVLAHRPGEVSSLMALAQLELSEGHPDEAIQQLEHAVQANPTATEPRLLLGTLYQRLGQPSRCLELMRGLPDDQAGNPSVLVLIGMAQLDLQQTVNAAATYEKLVEVEPNLARAHYMLAKTYALLGKEDGVRVELEKALVLDPDLLLAKLAMARLLMEENKPEEANRMRRELAKAYPDNVQVTALEGWLAMRQRRPKEAADAFRETLKKEPSSEVTVYLATSLWQQGDPKAAITTLKEWLTVHPTDLVVLFNLANSYLLLDRQNDARSAFARLVEQAPEHTLALNNLAWLLREEDPVTALKYAERAYDQTPNSPIIMDTLGSLLLDQGETRRALRLLQKASDAMPEDLDMRYRLAQALAKNGDKAEAREILDQLLGLDQQFEHRHDADALLQSLDG